jgi:DNA repair protein SbcC/Rad50
MRIRNVRFKNINSLAHEWELDFTAKDFTANGLFAIVGPTGAGKSSILDAMVLALYGRTPRQGSLTSENLVMTQGFGDCFSEVQFEINDTEYLARWEQKRARNKSDGTLQSPRRLLSKKVNGQWEPQTEKIAETETAIKEIVGLDYDQFTRAVLLPQGAFNRFLVSDDNERAAILEKISGATKYRDISKKVYERAQKETATLERLRANLGDVKIGNEVEEANARERFGVLGKSLEENKSATDQVDAALRWLTEVKNRDSDCAKIRNELDVLQNQDTALEPERQKLERANLALSLDAEYSKVSETRKIIAEKTKMRTDHETQRIQWSLDVATARTFWEEAVIHRKSVEEGRKKTEPIWDSVQKLDSDIAQKKKLVLELQPDLNARDAEIKKGRETVATIEAAISTLQKNEITAREYIQKYPQHESLPNAFSGLDFRLVQFEKEIKTLQTKEKEWDAAANDIDAKKKNFFAESESLKVAEEAKEKCLASDLDKVARVLRSTLRDEEACPVCGSVNHPVQGTEKDFSEASGVFSVVEKLDCLQKVCDAARDKVLLVKSALETATLRAADLKKEIESARVLLGESRVALLQDLTVFGLSENALENVAVTREQLKKWSENWTKCKSLLEQSARELEAHQKNLALAKAALERELDFFLQLSKKRDSIEAECLVVATQRKVVFGEKDVDTDRREWDQKIEAALALEKQKQETHATQVLKTTECVSKIQALSEELERLSPECRALEKNFTQSLSTKNFESETAFWGARLEEPSREGLSRKIVAIREALANKNGALKNAEDSLQVVREKQLTDKESPLLEKERSELTEKAKSLSEEKTTLEVFLKMQAENKIRQDQLRKEIFEQQAQQTIWEDLNKLIGAAKGDRLVKFVQGITLGILTAEANKRLKNLNPRYALKCDSDQLALSLVDKDFDEVRPTSNISGGESFQVSLALALGLSSMASNRVRIDTLFLDEGFGTLDSRTLQMAIQTLANLREEGDKLVGVITHVEALKEEIEVRIAVTPKGNGYSSLQGPGVRQVS